MMRYEKGDKVRFSGLIVSHVILPAFRRGFLLRFITTNDGTSANLSCVSRKKRPSLVQEAKPWGDYDLWPITGAIC